VINGIDATLLIESDQSILRSNLIGILIFDKCFVYKLKTLPDILTKRFFGISVIQILNAKH